MRTNKVKVLDRTKVQEVIKENKGKFFSAVFTKSDNTERMIHGRTGVKKYLRGGVNKVQKLSNALLTLWDRKAEDYRSLNIKTMSTLTLRGVKYRIV